MGFLDGAYVGQSPVEKGGRCHNQHRGVDQAGQAHGNYYVQDFIAKQSAHLGLVVGDDATLCER